NTVLKIEIDGTSVGSNAPCLHAKADDVTIRGLVVNRCGNYAVQAEDLGIPHENFVLEGCFLGTNADGTQTVGTLYSGVGLDGFSNSHVGGTTPAARNLISEATGSNQVFLGNATGNHVEGNLIGTDATGLHKLTTALGAVNISSGTGNVIGGTLAAARN